MLQALPLILMGLFIISCSNTKFSSDKQKGDSGGSKKVDPHTESVIESGDPRLTVEKNQEQFQKHKATFAVRNIACTMCHSNIQGSIISDLFLNSDPKSEAQTIATHFHYFHKKGGGAHIEGDFIVPKGEISTYSSAVTSGQSNCSFAGANSSTSIVKINILSTMKKCLEPHYSWGAGSNRFVEKSSIKINPISESAKIKEIYNSGVSNTLGVSLIGDTVITNITGNANSGYTISGKFQCTGAVVFNSSVALLNTELETSEKGCRIYAMGSIFAFGGIKLSNPKASIQLMSPIYVGIDISLTAFTDRFLGPSTPWLHFHKYSFGDYNYILNQVKSEMTSLNITAMGDGSFDYNRIALSAPVIFSRSKGVLSGTAIAELFIGPINATKYTYDPIWNLDRGGVPLWPEVKVPMVEIVD